MHVYMKVLDMKTSVLSESNTRMQRLIRSWDQWWSQYRSRCKQREHAFMVGGVVEANTHDHYVGAGGSGSTVKNHQPGLGRGSKNKTKTKTKSKNNSSSPYPLSARSSVPVPYSIDGL